MAATGKKKPKTSTPAAAPAPPPAAPRPPLGVVQVPVGELRPNLWNPNRMTPEMRHKLREYIRKEGMVQTIVARRLADHFQILDGEHRWRICKDELGYTTMPCVVVDMDDNRARPLTVNLNQMTGEPVPHLMAQLVHELSRDISLEDLATTLPYELPELKDLQQLLQLPEGLPKIVEEQAAKEEAEKETVMTFVVPKAGVEVVEKAIGLAAAAFEGKSRKGQALVVLAQTYLDKVKPADPTSLPASAGADEQGAQ